MRYYLRLALAFTWPTGATGAAGTAVAFGLEVGNGGAGSVVAGLGASRTLTGPRLTVKLIAARAHTGTRAVRLLLGLAATACTGRTAAFRTTTTTGRKVSSFPEGMGFDWGSLGRR